MSKLLIIIALTIIIGIYGNIIPGHMIILVGKYRIDLLLITALIILAVVYILIYYLTRLWVNVQKFSKKIKK
ncbi:MAG: hypothetical protein KBD37_03615 [Burkholderiales bacterium]|nr:hypothetical protein [Burkholderiales bacterium]